jgi:hypothetical protein
MKTLYICLVCALAPLTTKAELNGLIDLRAVSASDTTSWVNQGLGKQRFDNADKNIQLGQAILELKNSLSDTVTSKIVANGYTDRDDFVDLSEAYMQWKPLPFESGYRVKTKLGAFFPTLSLENGGLGWTNPWMISTSAINTWIGEEIKTIGTEITLGRPGQLHDSPHDVELLGSVFKANDPAGGLISWRGWSIGDRVTGLTETLPFPDMPSIYGKKGKFKKQGAFEKPFRELDHHHGDYVGLNYGYNGWITLRALHSNNHGDPHILYEQQWAWTTVFDQLALRVDFPNDLSLLSQHMKGYTKFGKLNFGVDVDFNSYYWLLSKAIGKHRISARYDHFELIDRDKTFVDNNTENGHALAATWLYNLNGKQQTGIECLRISSYRVGRQYLANKIEANAGADTVSETNVQIFYRYGF